MKKGVMTRFVAIAVAAFFLLSGCAHTYKVDTRLDELSSAQVEIDRKSRIETLSPSSVRAYHDVSMGQKVKYEKIEVKHRTKASVVSEITYTIIGRPMFLIVLLPLVTFFELVSIGQCEDFNDCFKDTYLFVFSPDAASRICCKDDYPTCTKTTKTSKTGETITKNENITHKQIPATSGKVAVYVEGKHKADIPIQSNGTARFSFGNYPVSLKGISNVKVEYKYKDAEASSLIAASEYAEEVKKHSKPCALAATFKFIDDDGLITAGEVYQYVYRKVSRFTKNRQNSFKSGIEERPIILGVIK